MSPQRAQAASEESSHVGVLPGPCLRRSPVTIARIARQADSEMIGSHGARRSEMI
jgi:hypothetical protein